MLSGVVRTAFGLEPTVGMSGLSRPSDVMHGAVKVPCVFLGVLWWMSGVGGVWGEEVRRGKECEYRKGGGLREKREIEMGIHPKSAHFYSFSSPLCSLTSWIGVGRGASSVGGESSTGRGVTTGMVAPG